MCVKHIHCVPHENDSKGLGMFSNKQVYLVPHRECSKGLGTFNIIHFYHTHPHTIQHNTHTLLFTICSWCLHSLMYAHGCSSLTKIPSAPTNTYAMDTSGAVISHSVRPQACAPRTGTTSRISITHLLSLVFQHNWHCYARVLFFQLPQRISLFTVQKHITRLYR